MSDEQLAAIRERHARHLSLSSKNIYAHYHADIDTLLALLADAERERDEAKQSLDEALLFHRATLAAANNRAEQVAAARQAEIADQLEERAAKLRHIGQTDKSNELVYVAGLLRADAIERGEWKGGGDAN